MGIAFGIIGSLLSLYIVWKAFRYFIKHDETEEGINIITKDDVCGRSDLKIK